MARSVFYGFIFWFLVLPFTVISSVYLGMTAIDKLLAPMLIVLWLGLLMLGNYRFDQKKILFILMAFAFFFIRNISKINESSVYLDLIWQDVILFGYFCLPIFYIDNLTKIKTASKLVSINAMVGCVSAFLVALGLLTLPYERFSQARFGLDIQKSVGLFGSYGDLAQFSAYFLLLAIFVPTNLALSDKSKAGKLPIVIAFAIIVMGLIGNQSRSLFLSLVAAIIMALIFRSRSKRSANKMVFNTLLFAIGISALSIITVTLSRITTFLGSMGGGQAEKTAMSRLEQYQYAFRVISEYPILGADGSFYSKFGASIDGIHNMWLGQLARGGFVSALILLTLLLMIFRASVKLLDNPQAKPYGLVAIGYMFAVLVSILFYPADTPLFWALLGMNVAIVATLKSHKQFR